MHVFFCRHLIGAIAASVFLVSATASLAEPLSATEPLSQTAPAATSAPPTSVVVPTETPTAASTTGSQQIPDNAKLLDKISVNAGIPGKNPTAGIYVTYEKSGDGFRILNISDKRPATIKEFQKQEILFFNQQLDRVQPDYRTAAPGRKNDNFECWTGVLRTRQDNKTTDYNPCESTLTDSSVNVLSTAMIAVFSLGAGAATGTSSSTVTTNPEKVKKLIEETDTIKTLLDYIVTSSCGPSGDPQGQLTKCKALQATFDRLSIGEFKPRIEALMAALVNASEDARLMRYRAAFQNASSPPDWRKFISLYEDYDPDGLIPRAKKSLVEAEKSLAEARAQLAREEEAKRAQQAIQRARTIEVVKRTGQTICATVDGVTRRQIGVALGQTIYDKPASSQFRIKAFTENASNEKIQIRIGSILRLDPNGRSENLQRLEGEPEYVIGGIIWDFARNWDPC